MASTWDSAYSAKNESERSWTQAVPVESLAIIDSLGLPSGTAVIDIGGGASYLVDSLVSRGFTDVTLLDVSDAALAESRSRNGDAVKYVSADVTGWQPVRTYGLWHDRAVFHFLTKREEQAEYYRALAQGTHIGSHLILATFAPDGPEMCSGLPVRRWSEEQLAARFEEHFTLRSWSRVEHTTPWGSVQPFTFVHFQRV